MKILLILSDGTRPDSLENLDFTENLKKESTYCMNAPTVAKLLGVEIPKEWEGKPINEL